MPGASWRVGGAVFAAPKLSVTNPKGPGPAFMHPQGIARALNIFRGTQAAPKYRLADMTGAEGWAECYMEDADAAARYITQGPARIPSRTCTCTLHLRHGDESVYCDLTRFINSLLARLPAHRQDPSADGGEGGDLPGAPVRGLCRAARRVVRRGALQQLHRPAGGGGVWKARVEGV